MTLLHLGAFATEPSRRIDTIGRLCERIVTPPIPIMLDRGALFGNGNHLVLTTEERNPPLSDFVRGLRRTFGYHGLLPASGVRFNPHVTVIYGCGGIEPIVPQWPYRWVADQFMLIYSRHGQGQHEKFGSWRLRQGSVVFPAPTQLDLGL